MAALSRMAAGTHPIDVGDGDTVLLASSLIPGNENAIYRVINALTDRGAHVVHKGNANVHVSGHASAGELIYCYNIIEPRHVLPVHGESRHLRANADLAVSTGIPADNVLTATNGTVIDLHEGRARTTGQIPIGLIYVDGRTVGGTTDELLAERRTLGEEGVVTVTVLIDPDTVTLTEDPDFIARGFAHDPATFDPVIPVIVAALRRAAAPPDPTAAPSRRS